MEVREEMISSLVDIAVNDGVIDLRGQRIDDQAAKQLHKALSSRKCSVEVFRLDYNHIGNKGLKYLKSDLTSRTVREIFLGSNELGEESAWLWNVVLAGKRLVNLSLPYSRLGAKGISELADGLKKNTTLKILDLSSGTFREKLGYVSDNMLDSLKRLGAAVATHPALEQLILHSSDLGANGLNELCIGFKTNESLVELDLQGNDLGSAGVECVADALSKNHSVEILNLSLNEVHYRGATALAEMLKTNATLRHLNLGQNQVGPEGATEIAAALSQNNTLTVLILNDNGLTSSGALALANMLKENSGLLEIQLESNHISPDGVCAIADALLSNETLTYLNLAWNLADVEGATKLAEVLGQNNTIETLILHGNNISAGGAAAFAEVLGGNQGLLELGLWYNGIKGHGASMLAEGLVSNMCLKTLDLRENAIDGEGAHALARTLNRNMNIEELMLQQNPGIRLAESIFLYACGGDRVKLDLSTNDQRVQSAMENGDIFRSSGIEPELVPEEVLKMDSFSYANDTAQYFHDLQAGKGGLVSYLKVLVVGSKSAGKTSIVNALLDANPAETATVDDNASVDSAFGHRLHMPANIDGDEFTTTRPEIHVYDFGRETDFYLTHARILSNRSLVLLAVDLTVFQEGDVEAGEVDEALFEEHVGRWVRVMQVQLERSRMVLIGTKGDLVGESKSEAILDALALRVRDMFWNLIQESEANTARGMSGYFIPLNFTPDSSFLICGNSPTFGHGIASLTEALEAYATDSFWGLCLPVPSSYAQLREYIADKADSGELVLDFESVRSELGFADNAYGFEVALKLLYKLGILIWCDSSAFVSSSDPEKARIRNCIFIRPSFIFHTLGSIFQNGLDSRAIPEDADEDMRTALETYKILYEPILENFRLKRDLKWGDLSVHDRTLYLDLLCELDLLAEVVDVVSQDTQYRLFRVPVLFREEMEQQRSDVISQRLSVREQQDLKTLYQNSEGTLRRTSISPFATSRMYAVHWHYEFGLAMPDGFFARFVSKLHGLMSIGEVNDHYVHGHVRFIQSKGKRVSNASGESGKYEPIYVTVLSARDKDGRGRMSIRAITVTSQRVHKGANPPQVLLTVFSQVIRRLDMLVSEFPSLPHFEFVLSPDPRWGLAREALKQPDENGQVQLHLFELHRSPGSRSDLARYTLKSNSQTRNWDVAAVHRTMAPSSALLEYVPVEQGLRGKDLWQFKQQLRADLKILLDRENASPHEAIWYLEQLLRLKGASYSDLHQKDLADIFGLKGNDRRTAGLLISLIKKFEASELEPKEVRVLIFCVIKLEARLRMKYDVCLLRTEAHDHYTLLYKKQADALLRVLTRDHFLSCVLLEDDSFGPEYEEQLDNSHVAVCCVSMAYIRKLQEVTKARVATGIKNVPQNFCKLAFETASEHRGASGALIAAIVDPAVRNKMRGNKFPWFEGDSVIDVSDYRKRQHTVQVQNLVDAILAQIFPFDKDVNRRRELAEFY